MSLSQGNDLTGSFARVEPSLAGVGDYVALMKPRVMSLVVFTALVGLVSAPGHLHPVIGFTALLCIAVGAGAAGALNMGFDADVDALMSRTAGRPIPRGRILPGEALAFGLTLAGGSIVVLGLLVSVLAAATGGIGIESILLFLIIFFWTPPHFWALSLYRADEYARAGIPMLPVVAGREETHRQILLYTLVLAPLGLAPWLFGFAGAAYGAVAIAGGGMMILLALQLRGQDGAGEERAARRLFAFSILYLFVLFAMLLVEPTGRLPPGGITIG